ncbi:MAG: hypothetical protein HKP27_00810, partial [Myxococcales bacterium]|nr:hypothetical protein [Myxococcales bacterium]
MESLNRETPNQELDTVLKEIVGEINFDPAELKARYLRERDKRMRDDGNDQYIEVKGDFSNYVDDPYAAPEERAPVFDEVEVVIIGGGFGGLLMGGRLR